MSATSVAKVGEPRLDPDQRLLHRFYEPLILLSILEPTRGSQNSHALPDSSSAGYSDIWHKFLDQLSYLCDYQHGGTTVSAIAAQSTPAGSIFWLTANAAPLKKALPHLEWVLRVLESLHDSSPNELDEVEEQMLTRCIEFSVDKVKNYSRRLCGEIGRATDILGSPAAQSADAHLIEYLESLQSLQHEHLQLCTFAYDSWSSDSVEHLSQKHSGAPEPSVWSGIRHYIGRLGSWKKAARLLVRVARSSPNLVSNFRIEGLVVPPPTFPPAADAQTNLNSALKRMLPGKEIARLQEIQETLTSIRVFDIPGAFLKKYTDKNFRPHIHAEVLLLEHFYFNDLQFVGNDRYIGCSKPSCYCCDLYMKRHPGNFVARPCHGNLWPHWSPPIAPSKDDQETRRHTMNILDDMIKKIRRDVMFQIMSRRPQRLREPDSTTGISTSIFASQMLGETNAGLMDRDGVQSFQT